MKRPDSTCPVCHEPDLQPPADPKPGDIAVCPCCTSIGIYTDVDIRRPTLSELGHILLNTPPTQLVRSA